MDHYLATIQTILDRCDDNNTSLSIDDIEVIKTNLCRIIKRAKSICHNHYNNINLLNMIGSKEVELEVVESSDASCEGCVFNNSKNYYCKDTHCIDVDRKDDIDVIYKEVKRS